MKWSLVNFCEFDKYAVKSYCAIHNVSPALNLGDITKVDENSIADFDMIVGGSPCQDFSVAGNQEGAKWICQDCSHKYNPLTVHYSKRHKCPKCDYENIDKTRSSLLVEWLRVIRGKRPKFAIYENVKNIVGAEFLNSTFKLFTEELNEYGYNVYWKVLNAKNYGIPQNRERVFAIIIRKDIDKGYTFPQPFYKKMSIKDIKLDVVDKKYYLSDEHHKQFNFKGMYIEKGTGPHQTNEVFDENGYARTLVAGEYKSPMKILEVKQVGNIVDIPQTVTVRKYEVDIENLKIVLKAAKTKSKLSNKTIAKILDKPSTLIEHWFRNDGCFSIPDADKWQDLKRLLSITTNEFDESIMTFEQKQGVFEKSNRHYLEDGISPTLTCGDGEKIITEECIRKLTPLEYFRLMGFNDADYHQAQSVNSDNQLYKQCGNSIVVNVLYYIFKKLQERYSEHFEDLRVSSFFSGLGAFEVALNRLRDGWEEPIEAKEIQEQITLF